MKKTLMSVSRKRNNDGTSTWTVRLGIKLIQKIANSRYNPEHMTYNPEESFKITMGVNNGKVGTIENLGNGKVIPFSVSYHQTKNKDESKVKVRYDFADERRFEYTFSKTFRSFNTGSLYRFFNDLIRKTTVLASVQQLPEVAQA